MRKSHRTQLAFRNGSHNRKLKDEQRKLNQPDQAPLRPWELMGATA